MTITSLSLGLVRIAAIFVDIKVADPGKPAASSLRRKLCPSATNIADSAWDRARASKTHNNLKFHCREKLHIFMITLGTLNYLRTLSAAYVKKGD